MFVILFVLILLFCCFSFFSLNKYKYSIAFNIVLLAVMLFLIALYISKISVYSFFTTLDYNLFHLFSNIKLYISDIQRCYIFCFSLFLLNSAYLGTQFINAKWFYKFLLIIPIGLLIYFTDPVTQRQIFINEHSTALGSSIRQYINIYNLILVHTYVLFPLIAVLYCMLKSKIYIRKHRLISSFLVILILVGSFLFIFVYSPYRQLFLSSYSVIDLHSQETAPHYSMIELTAVGMIFISFIIVLLLKPFKYYDNKRKLNRLATKALNQNIRTILHTHKNAFWCVSQQLIEIQNKINEGNTDSASEIVTSALSLSKESFDSIANTLAILNTKNFVLLDMSLISCIEKAIKAVTIPDDIKLICNHLNYDDILIKGNKAHITEVFVNIFSNSLDALAECEKDEKFIEISFITEDNLCCVSITDNGTGIKRKDIKKTFDLFYSTKPPSKNSGIGLPYVKKIVNMHHGDIRLKSIFGEYTRTEIVFPVSGMEVEQWTK